MGSGSIRFFFVFFSVISFFLPRAPLATRSSPMMWHRCPETPWPSPFLSDGSPFSCGASTGRQWSRLRNSSLGPPHTARCCVPFCVPHACAHWRLTSACSLTLCRGCCETASPSSSGHKHTHTLADSSILFVYTPHTPTHPHAQPRRPCNGNHSFPLHYCSFHMESLNGFPKPPPVSFCSL